MAPVGTAGTCLCAALASSPPSCCRHDSGISGPFGTLSPGECLDTMCGIAGVVGVAPTPEMLEAMNMAQQHRGPDDEGVYLGADVGLAFRRLAIVDLSGGHQPMSNEDGRIRLVFNGEIYDHALLRKELEARGHHFVTDHSDTEVLVHGWEEWG